MEIYVDDEAKLTLHGLTQNYVKLEEDQKNRKLFDLLDEIEFNQVGLPLAAPHCRLLWRGAAAKSCAGAGQRHFWDTGRDV